MRSAYLGKRNVAVGVYIQVGWLGGLYVHSAFLGKPGSQRVYIHVSWLGGLYVHSASLGKLNVARSQRVHTSRLFGWLLHVINNTEQA